MLQTAAADLARIFLTPHFYKKDIDSKTPMDLARSS
jgi:hypothetical protein